MSQTECRGCTSHRQKGKKKVKICFIYSAVYSSSDRSKRFTLHPLAGLFIPAPTRLLWEAFSYAAITREDYSLIFPPLSVARYSFIQLIELGHRGENENYQSLKWYQTGDSNPGSLVCESGILLLSYHAPRCHIWAQDYKEKHKFNSKQISDSAC